jgi:hypothetical protein
MIIYFFAENQMINEASGDEGGYLGNKMAGLKYKIG